MVAAWTYAVAVNFVPSYRDTADKTGDSQIGIVNNTKTDEEFTAAEPKVDSETETAKSKIG